MTLRSPISDTRVELVPFRPGPQTKKVALKFEWGTWHGMAEVCEGAPVAVSGWAGLKGY